MRISDWSSDVCSSDLVDNLGAWLDQAGFPDIMEGGKGQLDGEFEWHNLPWQHDKANLDGTLYIQLDNGRFSKVASRSARFLEIQIGRASWRERVCQSV